MSITKRFVANLIDLTFVFPDEMNTDIDDALFVEECTELLHQFDICMNAVNDADSSAGTLMDGTDLDESDFVVEHSGNYQEIVLPNEEIKIRIHQSLELSDKKLIRIIEIMYDLNLFQDSYERLTDAMMD